MQRIIVLFEHIPLNEDVEEVEYFLKIKQF